MVGDHLFCDGICTQLFSMYVHRLFDHLFGSVLGNLLLFHSNGISLCQFKSVNLIQFQW